MRPPGLLRPLAVISVISMMALAAACYEGPGPLEPPPGSPGGLCYEPIGSCDEEEGTVVACEPEGRYCYDKAQPCRGVFCGEHGVCQPSKAGLPVCYCDPGYSNAAYSLYCDEP